MLCRICGSEEHFVETCTNKSVSEFAQIRLENSTPADHVLSDFAAQMDIQNDLVEESVINDPDVAHIDAPNSDAIKFELCDKQENEPGVNELEVFDAPDEKSSAHLIALFVKNSH